MVYCFALILQYLDDKSRIKEVVKSGKVPFLYTIIICIYCVACIQHKVAVL